MAETRRTYTWVIHFDDPLMPVEVASLVSSTAEFWCQSKKGFSRPQVGGEALGVLQVKVTIQARDQWFVHRKAIYFAAAVAARCKVKLSQLGPPVPEKLPPHTNRGRYRWRAALSP